ncbi:hypothetical protein [Bradyrhizobium sp. ARR65]|uniref:hypothetical protein n=1 Tax=Bradyrhizobium sp. ARR65 TaxID=1040989 RepID=UPI001FDAA3CF|nr:hypothetical protein [Bradyrhizobium sp. ARR65]
MNDVAGKKGTVVVFICNHCPFVKAVIDRMVSDTCVLMSEGVGFAAICSGGVPRACRGHACDCDHRCRAC